MLWTAGLGDTRCTARRLESHSIVRGSDWTRTRTKTKLPPLDTVADAIGSPEASTASAPMHRASASTSSRVASTSSASSGGTNTCTDTDPPKVSTFASARSIRGWSPA